MQFKDIVGQRVLINRMTETIDTDRVSHAQMLLGQMGYGTLALAVAYVQYLLCEHRVHFAEDSELRADSCGECPNCKKVQNLIHPDLHFFFPTTTTPRVKEKPRCQDFREEFHRFLIENKMYVSLDDWYNYSGAENKQGQYRAADADEMVSLLGKKAYEGKQKVFLLWMSELMGNVVANKLLKSLEEPYENTLIMLICESNELMLPTVKSRVQTTLVPRILDGGLPDEAEGNYLSALSMAGDDVLLQTKAMFVDWMRLLFKLKMDALSKWVDNAAALGRRRQKAFLDYALGAVRRCFEQTVSAGQANLNTGDDRFDAMFPAMITSRNLEQIYNSINDAKYAIDRNANPKALFMYLSFQLSRHIKNR